MLLFVSSALATSIEYDNGVVVTSGSDSVTLQGRIQPRGTVELTPEPAGEALIRRARLKLGGHAIDWFGFLLQAGWDRSEPSLIDAFVDLAPVDKFHITAGRHKRPFGRDQIASQGKLSTVERAFTNSVFGQGRDIGLMVHSGIKQTAGVEYAVGAYETGALVARLGGTTKDFDTEGWSGATLDNESGLAIAGAVRAVLDPDDDESAWTATIDLMAKGAPVTVMGAAYIDADDRVGGFVDTDVLVGNVLPVVRYAVVFDDVTTHEVFGGAAVLLDGHRIKLIGDVGALVVAGEPTPRGRIQAEANF